MNAQTAIQDHATEFMADEEAAEIDETLWWMVGRRSVLSVFLERASRTAPIRRILEVGCGSGGDLSLLSSYGAVTGIERSPILARRAIARGIAEKVYSEDFFDLDLNHSFDLVCLFDVLEHIEDDHGFLRRLGEHAGSGHRLLISVPACKWLWSTHDELLHHHRRYSKNHLDYLLRMNGYEVLSSSYFVFFLFPVVAVARLGSRLMSMCGRKQNTIKIGRVPGWVNNALIAILKFEAWLCRRITFPVGVWAISLAQKKQ